MSEHSKNNCQNSQRDNKKCRLSKNVVKCQKYEKFVIKNFRKIGNAKVVKETVKIDNIDNTLKKVIKTPNLSKM